MNRPTKPRNSKRYQYQSGHFYRIITNRGCLGWSTAISRIVIANCLKQVR